MKNYFSQRSHWDWHTFKFGIDWEIAKGFVDFDIFLGFFTWGFIWMKEIKENQ